MSGYKIVSVAPQAQDLLKGIEFVSLVIMRMAVKPEGQIMLLGVSQVP